MARDVQPPPEQPKPPPPQPEPEPIPPDSPKPPPPAVTAASLRSRIRQNGPDPKGLPSPKPVLGKPGLYRVTRGRVCMGHADGETVYANEGATIELTAEEAGRMLADQTVEAVAV
jgi:hypothetical protein